MGTTGWLVTCLVCFGAVGLGIAASNDESQFRKPVNCRSRDNGNFVWGCSQFYSMCDNGNEVPMQCFSDLVLNPKNNFCDRRANVPACKDPSATRDTLYKAKNPFTCDRQRDGQYPKDDCSAEYILCNHGNQQIQRCPAGTFYDAKEGVCGWQTDIEGCNLDSSESAEDDVTIVERGQPRQSWQSQSQQVPPQTLELQPQPSEEQPLTSLGQSQLPQGESQPLQQQPQPSEGLPQLPSGQPQPSEGEPQPSQGQAELTSGQQLPSQGQQQLPSGQQLPSQGQRQPSHGHQQPSHYHQRQHRHHRQHRRVVRSIGAQLQYQQYQQQPQTPSIGAPIAQPIQDPAPQVYQQPQQYQNQAYQQPQPIPQDPPAVIRRPIDFDCSQRTDGYYALQQDCAKDYVACVGGQAHEFQCPASLVFDAAIQACDYPTECGKPRATTARAPISFDCSARPDGYHTSGPCTKDYYHCLAGTTFALACPAGTVFDSAIEVCDWPETCGQPRATQPPANPLPINPYQQAPPAPPADAIRPVSFDCSQRADGIHVEQPCQDHYVSCANGIAHQFACAPGTLFDPNTQACEFADACGKAAPAPPPANPLPINPYQQAPPAPPADVIRPVSFDCSQRADGIHVEQPCLDHYFSCANGIAHQFACAPGTLYDPNTQSCEFADACGKAAPAPPPANPPAPSFLDGHGGAGSYFQPQQGYQQQPQQQSYGQQHQPQQSPPSIPVAPVAPVETAPVQSDASSDITITINTQTTDAGCASLTDGNHPVADCSQEYSSCWGGAGVRAKCPGSLIYNPENNFCDFRENVAGCSTPPAQDAPAFSCGAKPPGFYGSGCSGTYFHCDGGISVPLACPAGLLFSESTQRCDHRESVTECGGSAPSPIAPPPQVQSEAVIPPAPLPPQQPQYIAAPPSAPQQPLQQSPSAYQPAPQQWQPAPLENAQAQPLQPIVSQPQQYSQQGRRRARA